MTREEILLRSRAIKSGPVDQPTAIPHRVPGIETVGIKANIKGSRIGVSSYPPFSGWNLYPIIQRKTQEQSKYPSITQSRARQLPFMTSQISDAARTQPSLSIIQEGESFIIPHSVLVCLPTVTITFVKKS